ncbi:MAG: mechanosensitive ion channel [Gemmatimonadales bacterium]|nr:mechanosensitive ion channel [Gemmatimonadales bacterium]
MAADRPSGHGSRRLLLVLSIWVDDPRRLTTAAGLVTAGVAIALQRVVTAFAAYFIILRARVFRSEPVSIPDAS